MHSRLKIGQRLALGFGTLVVMLLTVSGLALWCMGTMRSSAVEVNNNWLPSVELVNRMNTAATGFRIREFQHVLNTDDKAMATIEKDMAAALADFETHHQAYVKLISSDAERSLHAHFTADWQKYLQLHEQVLVHSRQNQNVQAKALLEGESRRLFDDSSATLVKLVDLNHDGAVGEAARSDQAYATALRLMVGSAIACLLAAVALGLWLVRDIRGQLGGEPADVAALANAIADADLSRSIPVRSGDTGSVVAAMARMQAALTRTVGAVRGSSQSVAAASAQIAQGNQDLSQRTEEQASALEQTAASMEQLGSTVRQNADNAKQANQLALGASGVAVKGGDVVGQVVQTIKGINDSSKKIADIIGVIDGIAFQTNILALNAAVEAARAGEHGRGFAVVAGEVRSLAQRSAAAAKEIKSLISDSVTRVEQGTALVDQAGETMSEIVRSIQRVSDIVGEISAASSEQSAGVGQVGEAVSQMDQTTQQNAALVEQSAAAAESLRQQAQQLVQAVAVFKLGSTGLAEAPSRGAAPARAAAASGRRAPERAPNKAVRPAVRPAVAARPARPAEPAGTDHWESF